MPANALEPFGQNVEQKAAHVLGSLMRDPHCSHFQIRVAPSSVTATEAMIADGDAMRFGSDSVGELEEWGTVGRKCALPRQMRKIRKIFKRLPF